MWWSLVIVLVIVGVLGLVIYTPKKLYEGVMLIDRKSTRLNSSH